MVSCSLRAQTVLYGVVALEVTILYNNLTILIANER